MQLNDILRSKGFELFKLEGEELVNIDKAYTSEKAENIIAVRDVENFTKRTGLTVIEAKSN